MWQYFWQRRLEFGIRLMFAVIFLALFGGMNVTQSLGHWRYFQQTGCSYDQMRRGNLGMRIALEAAERIPRDARYAHTRFQANSIIPVRIRYAMCPNRNFDPAWDAHSPHWDYYLDVSGEITTPDPAWARERLSGDAVLYARNGHSFSAAAVVSEPWMPRLRGFLFLVVAQILVGTALLCLCRITPERGGAAWFLGAAYLMGFATITGAIWLLLLFGVTLSSPVVYACSLTITAVALLGAWRRLTPCLRNLFSVKALRDTQPLALFIAVVVCCFLALYILPTLCSPVMSWDAQSHWIYKANALFHHGTLGFSAITAHNEYPLLWPLNIAMQYALIGGAYDEVALWTIALMLLALFSQLMGACALLGLNACFKWAAPYLFLLLFHEPSLRWAYAETPFLAILTAALVMCCGRLSQDERGWGWTAAALFFACALSGVKFEGGPNSFILAASLALLAPRFPFSGRGWLHGLLFSLPLFITLGWYYYQRSHGYIGDTHLREPLTLQKLQALYQGVMNVNHQWHFGYLMFMGAAGLVLVNWRATWSRQERFLGLTALGLVVFSVASLTGWTTEHLGYAVNTALPRLILHAAPSLLLVLLSQAARLLFGPDGTDAATTAAPDDSSDKGLA